jgi:hypothetical protein
MTFRKYILGLLVFLMLGMQFMLAEHAKIHFSEEEYVTASSRPDAPQKQDGHGDHDKICQICLFDKIFSGLILSQAHTVAPPVSVANYGVGALPVYAAQELPSAYLPRGPPAFLS